MALTGREMRPCWPQKVAVCTIVYLAVNGLNLVLNAYINVIKIKDT